MIFRGIWHSCFVSRAETRLTLRMPGRLCESVLRCDHFCSRSALVRCWWSTGLHCHQILSLPWFFFPLTLLLQIILFFKIIFARRSFKRCITITNNKEITAMIFCYFFLYFLIHKIIKHGPEGKSHLPFKCEYLWIFGRNTFKSGLCAKLPFTTGKCLQKYVDKIHISHNCELDQQCPWARIVKKTNPASFS